MKPEHAICAALVLASACMPITEAMAEASETSPALSIQLASNNIPFRVVESNVLQLASGTHFLAKPLIFDSSFGPIMIQGREGDRTILSAGIQVTNWQLMTKKDDHAPEWFPGRIWKAQIPQVNGKPLGFRQLWINGHRAVRAQNPQPNQLFRLAGWNKTNQTAIIPATSLLNIIKPGQIEMVVDQVWEIAVLRLKSIKYENTNAVITFRQPESRIEFEHPWPPVIVNSNYAAPFYLANAIEFLDSPGEWFADVDTAYIYYWPRPDEDMEHAEVIAPVLENLVQIEGSLDKPACHIRFKDITFAHTTWLRPSELGHVPLQAGMFMLDAKKLSPAGTLYAPKLDNLAWIGRPPAAVTVKSAKQISFENCTFEHLAATGLDFDSGTSSNLVNGCTFHDIGGNGLQIGEFSQTNVETHTPFYPSDYRVICSRETISNNSFTRCGVEDWGCIGICVGYARDINIHNNEVSQMPYTGISVGWGWTKHLNASRDNLIIANHIHHVGQILGDLGGIYTLSAQPGTVVAENYIHDMPPSPYVADPNHWFYLYLDEGSSYITVRDNWCPSEKFLKNANGPGNIWTNNGPQVSDHIKAAAGPKL